MRAYVFSIGESTTGLCCELMKDYGFEVTLYQDGTTLWDKLKRFYTEVLETGDEEAIRIDADVIPNKNVKQFPTLYQFRNWYCAWGWDFYKQDQGTISIHYMTRPVIKTCLEHIEEAKKKIRPETYLWRLPEVNSQTMNDKTLMYGMHGYGQQDQRNRIKNLKYLRNQEYDWDLVERIEAL